ncbi:hypothetical protein LJB42_000687 [Komagataella kurtzmanii]|nr:hypothetical protein LJB42_000687 [Komagataella kurtzmanii]
MPTPSAHAVASSSVYQGPTLDPASANLETEGSNYFSIKHSEVPTDNLTESQTSDGKDCYAHSSNNSVSSIQTNFSDITLVDRPFFHSKEPSRTDSLDSKTTLTESLRHKHLQTPPATSSSPSFKFNTPARPIRHSSSKSQTLEPTLRKFPTSPYGFKNPDEIISRMNKDYQHTLSSEVQLLSSLEVAQLLANCHSYEELELSNLIIIDVRPFAEYCKSHLPGSINICLPSTLAKRPTFTLQKCLSILDLNDRNLFYHHLEHSQNLFKDGNIQNLDLANKLNNGIPYGDRGLPAVLIYDLASKNENSCSLPLSTLTSKFVHDSQWNSPIYTISGGFSQFNEDYPALSLSSLNPNICSVSPDPIQSHAATEASSPKYSRKSSLPVLRRQLTENTVDKSPTLTKFTLPDPPSVPLFKTRLGEEVISSKADYSMVLNMEDFTDYEKANLPPWILRIIGDDHGATAISKKFYHLEINEKERLSLAFSNKHQKSDRDAPKVSKGVELGSKNRYKDIFPYEHSRVKLVTSPVLEIDHSEDYINANYLTTGVTPTTYIATQGPLKETIGDFWRLILDQGSYLIFSLTAQNENGVEKCAPFWKCGEYTSGRKIITVELIESDENVKLGSGKSFSLTVRRLRVSTANISREVLQLQVSSWPDFGTLLMNDLLNLIYLRRYIARNCRDKEHNVPIVVHCSAGCGRTGTFCSIDAVVEHLLKDSSLTSKNCSATYDPVWRIVEEFRKQRVFMVQTLRQYLLVYDTIILFLRLYLKDKDSNVVHDHCDYSGERISIVENFVETKRKEQPPFEAEY